MAVGAVGVTILDRQATAKRNRKQQESATRFWTCPEQPQQRYQDFVAVAAAQLAVATINFQELASGPPAQDASQLMPHLCHTATRNRPLTCVNASDQ